VVSCTEPGHLDVSRKVRRACSFLLTASATIRPMAIQDQSEPARVAIVIRIQLTVHDGLRRQVECGHVSINGYLERLVLQDLAGSELRPFTVVSTPRFTSKGERGTGRPSKGARAAVKLRVGAGLRVQIHRRATFLHLTVNDYLESLVLQDISAATPAGEEMAFDQIA
jgi:hypothetical protein